MSDLAASADQVRHLLWLRQGFDIAGHASALDALDALTGVYGTAPTCYLSLCARVPHFALGDLDDELYRHRRAARLRCMRGSSYCISEDALPVVFRATQAVCERPARTYLRRFGFDDERYEDVAAAVEDALRDGPLAVTGLRAAAGDGGAGPEAFRLVIALMAAEGRIVRASVKGTWRSDAHDYALTSQWLPGVDLFALSPEDAAVELAHRYLQAFGPATAADFTWWSGLPRAAALRALAELPDQVVTVAVEELVGEHLLSSYDADALTSLVGSPDGVALLPVWDTYLMGYRDRARMLDPEQADCVIDPAGNATSVVLDGGRVTAVWDLDEEDDTLHVKVAPLGREGPSLEAVAAGAARIASALGGRDVAVHDVGPAPSLHSGRRSQFIAPLRDV